MDSDLFGTVLVLLVVAVILAMVGWRVSAVFFAAFNHWAGNFWNRHLLSKSLEPVYKSALANKSAYYRKLKDREKQVFERRVQKFIDLKEFVPRGELLEVTADMKALVAATAVQITQGFPRVYFRHFKKILIYPDDYYSQINRRYHQGEVHTKGLILLSWRSFKAGYGNPSDGVHLGLHEMAHALKIENNISNNDYLYLDPRVMDELKKGAAHVILKIRSGEETFFRKDAGANFHEFFAVAIENFFERPALFQQNHQSLFTLLATLLKQTPPGL